MNQEYFTIEIASEINLGLPLADLGAVIQLETANICTVPGVASFWYGVVNFKGSLLWVLDSDRFFMRSLSKTPKGLASRRAPHRFSNLKLQNQNPRKLTAVILQTQQSGNQKKVALVTQKLKGLTTVDSSCLQSLSAHVSSELQKCCLAMVHEAGIYVIDSVALLQQLHQQSSLVSV